MARTSSPWWRKIGITLAALVLTVLTFGPGLEGLLCRDEGGLIAVAAEGSVAQVLGAEHSRTDDAGICVHGHCHHATPYVTTSLTSAETPEHLLGVSHPLWRSRVPTSDLKFSLIRPPRA